MRVNTGDIWIEIKFPDGKVIGLMMDAEDMKLDISRCIALKGFDKK
jgi:hypothetical protein